MVSWFRRRWAAALVLLALWLPAVSQAQAPDPARVPVRVPAVSQASTPDPARVPVPAPVRAQAPAPAPTTIRPAKPGEASLALQIALHEVDEDRRAPLQEAARRAIQQVEADLGVRLTGTLYVDFVGSEDAFAQVMADHGVRGWQEEWLAGLALLGQQRVIVHVNGSRALTTSETIHHELVHIALHALSPHAPLPRWYQEGVAMYLAGELTWERIKQQAGAGPLGQLESLSKLDAGFRGSQVAVERAYAMAAGFARYAVNRAGGERAAIGRFHALLLQGIGFDNAFAMTFGERPAELYSLYAALSAESTSAWTLLMDDSILWLLISLLGVVAMTTQWRHRPELHDDDEPLDLEAIAAAGRAATAARWRRAEYVEDLFEGPGWPTGGGDGGGPTEDRLSNALTAAADEPEPLASAAQSDEDAADEHGMGPSAFVPCCG